MKQLTPIDVWIKKPGVIFFNVGILLVCLSILLFHGFNWFVFSLGITLIVEAIIYGLAHSDEL